MKKNKKYIIILVVLLAIGSFIAYKRSQPQTSKANRIDVTREIVRKTVSASGTIVSENEADLSFAASGEISEIYVKTGDDVKRGELLASLYNYDTSQTVKAAKDTRDVAKRDLELFIQTYEDNKDDLGGSKEYEIGVKRLEELLSKAEASYQATIGTLSKTYIYAPFSATVVDIFKEKGEIASAGESILKTADLNNLFFETDVDQEDFGALKINQQVEIELDPYETNVFNGTVSKLPKYADSDTEQFTIRISITKDNEHSVLLGMRGDAKIIVSTTSNEVSALVFDSIFKDEGGTYVWVLESDKLKKLPIEVGLEGDLYTEVKTDLSGKEIYVPVGNEEFKEGNKVQVEE
uniref:Efflux RND transporter periplasmic adaptor subunit n=1 Tax=candidate division WWE3 bacterium TaxID=2053526 RepID=A0A7C4Y347_UNCKA